MKPVVTPIHRHSAIDCGRFALANVGRRCGFTLTELLVVIGIIVLLVGILLTALATARSRALATSTLATMEGFRQACETYQLEHEEYPGIVPDRVLQSFPEITSTESAILALMGGARVLKPSDDTTPDSPAEVEFSNYSGVSLSRNVGSEQWQIKIDVNRIGEGPYVKGKNYAPYFTPKESELGPMQGVQTNETQDNSGVTFVTGLGSASNPVRLPDLLDGWGQPILYARRVRSVGVIVGDAGSSPQFLFSSTSLVGTAPYTQARQLGKLGADQTTAGGTRHSILNLGAGSQQKIDTWAQVLEHPSLRGEPRGAVALISAGPDGIYFSSFDGSGSSSEPITSVGNGSVFYDDLGPSIISEFDDIRVFGGE